MWASSGVLAGHYLTNQKLALVILLLLVIKVFFFLCQACPCIHMCKYAAKAVYQLLH